MLSSIGSFVVKHAQWEYCEEAVAVRDLMAACRHFGSDGWELAGMLPCHVKVAGRIYVHGQQPVMEPGAHLIFKRPVSTPPEANGHAADT